MAILTTEENRALVYNLSLRKRAEAKRVRELLLQGKISAAADLQSRTAAIQKGDENERIKIKSAEIECTGDKSGTVNG